VGVLWDADSRFAGPLLQALSAEEGLVVGDNEPYDGALAGDTVDRHATIRAWRMR
jgi:predicted N-formylglutamate amidohydrolase